MIKQNTRMSTSERTHAYPEGGEGRGGGGGVNELMNKTYSIFTSYFRPPPPLPPREPAGNFQKP